MKLKAVVVLLICCSLFFQSCWLTDTEDDVLPQIQEYYEPVTMQRSEFNATTILQTTAEVIVNSGKIYVKDNFIFINECNKGFHIIDNTDPTNPQNIAFLNVLGSSDLTIKGNSVYVNNATDLLAITLNPQLGIMEITKRVPNAFPQITSPFGNIYYGANEDEVVVDWIFNGNIN
ncbi:hypothetical protein ES692_09060 [Psychroserpens burtonensis]|uniref:LVIVD repeat-containing protein n=1 Tax=Psychroserpens burtonensis TaxID=49278 RepID=A0A5C7BFT4_9FLAO|nr:hypothetical protein [Psychroserpens burtonensis]TXE17416.1 hypothetical protein ES692_09060 [Psychroserpens burtonensis]